MDATNRPEPVPTAPESDLFDPFAEVEPTPVQQPQPRQPDQPKHSQRAVNLAKQFGATDQQIAGVTAAQLNQWVYEQTLALNGEARAYRAGNTQSAVAARREAPQAQPEVPADEDFSLEDENLYGEDVRKAGRVIKKLRDEIKELRTGFGTAKQSFEAAQQSAVADALDLGFESLGEQAARVFGAGSAADLQGTAEMGRRVKFINISGVAATDSPKTIARKLKAAYEEMYGPVAQAEELPAPDSPYGAAFGRPGRTVAPAAPRAGTRPQRPDGKFMSDAEIEAWNGGAVARPTQRRVGNLPPGRQRAIQSLSDRMSGRTDSPEPSGNGSEFNGHADQDDFLG